MIWNLKQLKLNPSSQSQSPESSDWDSHWPSLTRPFDHLLFFFDFQKPQELQPLQQPRAVQPTEAEAEAWGRGWLRWQRGAAAAACSHTNVRWRRWVWYLDNDQWINQWTELWTMTMNYELYIYIWYINWAEPPPDNHNVSKSHCCQLSHCHTDNHIGLGLRLGRSGCAAWAAWAGWSPAGWFW